jgi:hypothetical protein
MRIRIDRTFEIPVSTIITVVLAIALISVTIFFLAHPTQIVTSTQVVYSAAESPSESKSQEISVTSVVTPAYPSAITYTVSFATTSGGHYCVYTTAGQSLYFKNYEAWNNQIPRDTYTADIVGMDGSAYLVENSVRISTGRYSGSWDEYNREDYTWNVNRDTRYSKPKYSDAGDGMCWQTDLGQAAIMKVPCRDVV